MAITLGELAKAVGARLRGDPAMPITGLATLQGAGPGQISFLSNPRYRPLLEQTRASAVVLTAADAAACTLPALIVKDPYLAYAHLAALFAPPPPAVQGVHPSAWVDPAARVAADAWVGPQCVVEAGAVLGPGVFVGPGCVVGEGAVLGDATRLVANVTVCHGARLGRRVLVHPGAVIGSDGFGLANDAGRWLKIPQLGSVVIGDDVEIGANTTIDRGALDDTVIEEGVKLDNQIQVAHNVHIGAHTAVAGCVGIAGSARIGRHCTLAGGVGVAGHLEIADHVHVTGMSMVTESITAPGVYSSGLGVEPGRVWKKIRVHLRHLDDLARRVAALEKKVRSDAAQ